MILEIVCGIVGVSALTASPIVIRHYMKVYLFRQGWTFNPAANYLGWRKRIGVSASADGVWKAWRIERNAVIESRYIASTPTPNPEPKQVNWWSEEV